MVIHHKPRPATYTGRVTRYAGGKGEKVILTQAEFSKARKRYDREYQAFLKRKAKYEKKHGKGR